ncbi:PPOX class F420-dependent oxidoreductase [Nocardiopsis mangrovi]|uniref:PPOX class F420-dependent oxidoreductase n=1 Tax=Nocardiopsis mangrovi TaxID=1179818 RepID=A0ABV9DYW5_9ACTN
MSTATLLRPFRAHRTALLTTYRSDGLTCVNTPVTIVIDDGRVLFRTWEDSGEAERLRHHPQADLRPCTLRGEPVGGPIRGDVGLLEGPGSQHAERLLARRHPMLQRLTVPISLRLLRYRTLHYELIPRVESEEFENMEGCPD